VDGLPLVGGRLYTYGAGTSTPKDTYTSFALSASNTNPIILDARGEASVWMFGSYRFVLKDANDVLIWDVDDVRDVTNSSTFTGVTLTGTLTVSSSSVTWAGNPTHSGNHTFTNNVTFNGNVTIGDSTVDSLTIKPTAVTWGTTTTHSGAHVWSGTTTFSGVPTFAVSPVASVGMTFGNADVANTTRLDWYEEGATNLSIEGTSTAGTASYASRSMKWQRIGNRVHFNVYMSWSATTGTGNIKFTGLPYAPADTITPITVWSESLTFSNALAAYVSSSNHIALTSFVTNAAATAVAIDATGDVYMMGSYRCA
jgi:hypothetical protein